MMTGVKRCHHRPARTVEPRGVLTTHITMFAAFFFLQLTSWLFVGYLFVSQVLSVVNYELGVAMGTQESLQVVGSTGVAFNKGFMVADTVFYLPLMAMGLIFHYCGLRVYKVLLGGAYSITIYWSLVAAVVVNVADDYKLPEKTREEWKMRLPFISLWGLVCLFLILEEQTPVRVSLIKTMAYLSGVVSPFFYFCNDYMHCAIHAGEKGYSWKSTTISDFSSTTTANTDDQFQAVSTILLVASALSLIVFGAALAVGYGDWLLGALQVLTGGSNLVSSTTYRLVRTSDVLQELPRQSQVHMGLVCVSIALTVMSLLRDMMHTRTHGMWPLLTKLDLLLVGVGVMGAILRADLVGAFERLAVYTIHGWTACLAMDLLYQAHRKSTIRSKLHQD